MLHDKKKILENEIQQANNYKDSFSIDHNDNNQMQFSNNYSYNNNNNNNNNNIDYDYNNYEQQYFNNNNNNNNSNNNKNNNSNFSSLIPTSNNRNNNNNSNSNSEIKEYEMGNYSWSDELVNTLGKLYGYRTFRENQLAIMNATLNNRDVFVLMPTGGGKSLCFQLPALCSQGVTIVISPLIALIQDQVIALQNIGVTCNYIGSGQLEEEENKIFSDLYKRIPTIKLLYVTPEKVMQSGRTWNTITRLFENKNLSRIVIDEAHCVSQWGHEFRPDYTKLNKFKDSFPTIPIMALTATATERVKQDIINNLSMFNPLTFKSSFNRPNIIYEIRRKTKGFFNDIVKFIKEKYNDSTGIIYCLARKDCEKIANKLVTEYGINAAYYHGNMSNEDRYKVQQRWLTDDIKIIVATIAFGLGINKPDVRYVIHYTIPKSIEGYYQETGRAGRDGDLCHAILFYNYKDKFKVEFLIKQEQGMTPQFRNHVLDNLNQMVSFCENQVDCRRVLQLQYFGEQFDKSKCNSTCDNCKNGVQGEELEVTDVTKKLILLVREMLEIQNKITTNQIIQLFRGKQTTATTSKGFTSLKNISCGSQFNKLDAERIIYKLIQLNALREQTEKNGMGFPTTYINLNDIIANKILNGFLTVKLHFSNSKKTSNSNSLTSSSSNNNNNNNNNNNKLVKKSTKSSNNNSIEQISDDLLFRKLMLLRNSIATQSNLPPYHIFQNQTLIEMAAKKPQTLSELSDIYGVGRVKLNKYGQRFLDEILASTKKQVTASPSPFFKGNNLAPKRSRDTELPNQLYQDDLLDDDTPIYNTKSTSTKKPTTKITALFPKKQKGDN